MIHNLIQRRDGLAGYVTEFIYPSASNRLNTQRDSAVGEPGHTDRNFMYDAAGNRLRSALQSNDTIYWQYDAVARLVGTVKKLSPAGVVLRACAGNPPRPRASRGRRGR